MGQVYSESEVREATLKYFDNDSLATDVWMKKYALRNENNELLELTPDDMHRRLAKEFARIEAKYPKPMSEDEIYEYLKGFKGICPQGSPMAGIGNNYSIQSLSNCVVIDSPKDDISSIFETAKSLANLFKYRSGVGFDLSTLRPEGMRVNNAAKTTSGAWSFADFYSYVTRMIGQGSRRGALILTMGLVPDIEKFITCKHDKTKVTGANISVKITNDFMKAVENDKEWELRWPLEGKAKFTKIVKAKELWNLIIESATKTGDPGILFWDNVCEGLPANEYEQFKTLAPNPCSELSLEAGGACRLISINLSNFVDVPFTDDSSFDDGKFVETVKVGVRLSDDLVDLEIEKLQKIIDKVDTKEEKELFGKLQKSAIDGRRVGLGIHGLADMLAKLQLKYGSDESIAFVDNMMQLFKDFAYRESVLLAQERGPFPVFDWETEKNNKFIKSLEKGLQQDIEYNGRRNISLLTCAPTGSVSILCQSSSGIEPVFRNKYTRRRKLNYDEKVENEIVDNVGERWVEYNIYHHNVAKWMKMFPGLDLPDFFIESDKVDWLARIKMQEVISKQICHSVASTINLPRGTSPEIVGQIYMEAWKHGLKGITVYVEGSKDGILISNDNKKESNEFIEINAFKRPEVLDCEIHQTTIKGEKWIVLVGLLNGRPYEVFAGQSNKIVLPKHYTRGSLTKKTLKTKSSKYDLTIGDNGDTLIIRDVVDTFDNPELAYVTRLISLSLRHGANIQFIVEQLGKDKESDMFAFNKIIARILKKYIVDGRQVSQNCPECGQKLVYQEGCVLCSGCGFSRC